MHPLHLSLISKDTTYMFFAFEIALLERGIAFNRYFELEKEENVRSSWKPLFETIRQFL